LTIDAPLPAHFDKFAELNPEAGYYELMDLWLDELGIVEEGDFYGPRWSFNTYNFENWLVNQTLQGSFFGLGKKTYLIVQVHGGADVRGGYTSPKVFQLKGFYGKDEFILHAGDISFTCQNCESSLKIEEYTATFTNVDGEEVDIEREEIHPTDEFTVTVKHTAIVIKMLIAWKPHTEFLSSFLQNGKGVLQQKLQRKLNNMLKKKLQVMRVLMMCARIKQIFVQAYRIDSKSGQIGLG
jgi:hypothetical protein